MSVSPTQILLDRQVKYLPLALLDLNTNNKKTEHWAWWAFPTQQGGANELTTGLADKNDPYPTIKSAVHSNSGPYLCDVWVNLRVSGNKLLKKYVNFLVT